MQPHQQRVVDEKTELAEKLNKLHSFLLSDFFKTINDAEQNRLKRQAQVMEEYLSILEERIQNF